MHLDVKIVGSKVYLRHGDLGTDTFIVLLRKKKRSAYRRTGGARSYARNIGVRKRRQPKCQYVHFKGIRLSKGTPGKWYVPKCIAVADGKTDSALIGKELPTLCHSLFYVGEGGVYRMQGSRKKIVLKTTPNSKGICHKAYAPIGIQIARLRTTGGKDSGGEIVRLKYRVSQKALYKGEPGPNNRYGYGWVRSFSMA